MTTSNAITPLTPAQVVTQEAQAAKEGYIARLPRALDIFANEVLGGQMDETISTRVGIDVVEHRHNPLASAVAWSLDEIQRDHVAKAAAGDTARAQAELERVKASGELE